MYKLLLADDHQLILDGLEKILLLEKDIEIVKAVNNGQEVISFVENHFADLILMDLDMPVKDGLETTIYLKQKHPSIKILILTMHQTPSIFNHLKEIGADGYMVKNSDQSTLIQGIRKVLNGEKYFQKIPTDNLKNTASIIENKIKVSDLTDRELEILKLIAKGYSNKQIGEHLFISHRTADTHRTNLMKKLQVNNIAGLIKIAFQANLIH